MTWTAFHRRGEVLRTVVETADQRVDGELPLYIPGVAETFADATDLLGALQLRWHTRLAGRIERELMSQPMDLEEAVVTAWLKTVDEMPGVRAVLDRALAQPMDDEMARCATTAAAKEHVLLAVMAGRGGPEDPASATVGERIETRAREVLKGALAA
jgi:hypothetical protein